MTFACAVVVSVLTLASSRSLDEALVQDFFDTLPSRHKLFACIRGLGWALLVEVYGDVRAHFVTLRLRAKYSISSV